STRQRRDDDPRGQACLCCVLAPDTPSPPVEVGPGEPDRADLSTFARLDKAHRERPLDDGRADAFTGDASRTERGVSLQPSRWASRPASAARAAQTARKVPKTRCVAVFRSRAALDL